MSRHTYEQKLASATRLQRLFLPNPVVYSLVRHTSRKGWTTFVDFFTINENRPWKISANMAIMLDAQTNRDGQLILCDSEGRNAIELAVSEFMGHCQDFGLNTSAFSHVEL